tara:strand:- start:13 stop:480 length:468 start_codon:yes stop_codon:yes gene_type:complete
MRNLFIHLLITFIFSSCTLNKVVNHHGVHFLKKKQEKLFINKSNKNDILRVLGSPSTKSFFINDVWIFIERKSTKSGVYRINNEEITVNNVLILEIDRYGLLYSKDFLDISNMKKLEIIKASTEKMNKKDTFIYDFLSNVRRKMNDPLGVRTRKK